MPRPAEKTISKTIKTISRYYPFTCLGTALFGVGLYLLGNGYSQGNPYAILIALVSLLTLILFAVLGRVEASGIDEEDLVWDSSAPLVARRKDTRHRVAMKRRNSLFFFRYHFSIGGVLKVEKESPYYFYREVSFPGGIEEIPLWLPFCGVLRCRGRSSVKDIFGFTLSRLPFTQERRLVVLPYQASLDSDAADAVTGSDSVEKQREAENEKYYMREYMAGDRFRDINWKASTRTEDIFTRISPESIEETTLLTILFRNYFDPNAGIREASKEGVSQLNGIKSFILAFIATIQRDHPDYRFLVHHGTTCSSIETKEDMRPFAEKLGETFYTREDVFPPFEEKPAFLFVFTTVFDSGLPGLINRLECPAEVYRTVFPRKKDLKEKKRFSKRQITETTFWRPEAKVMLPGPWAIGGRGKMLKYPGSGTGGASRVVDLAILPKLLPSGEDW